MSGAFVPAVLASAILGLAILATAAPPARADAGRLVEIEGGRKIYMACQGAGSPTVMLVGGLKASADDWDRIVADLARTTRVCAFDRPGTPVGEQSSRSDPVPQPTSAADAVADLRALVRAAPTPVPFVLAGHSYGGLIAKLYARTNPADVAGLVLVDALTEGLRDAETPEQWTVQRELMQGEIRESVALYPALERIDPDRSFDQVRAAPPLKALPLAVLSADRPWGPLIPGMIADGTLPADTPPGFGYVTDAAQAKAQAQLATLAPGARHVTQTNSGHEIHKDRPGLVIDTIAAVVAAVRAGRTRLDP